MEPVEKRVSKVEALPRLAPEFRVAAYARVSSEKDAMHHSLSAQVSYYSNLMQMKKLEPRPIALLFQL